MPDVQLLNDRCSQHLHVLLSAAEEVWNDYMPLGCRLMGSRKAQGTYS